MSDAKARFDSHLDEARLCIQNFDVTGHAFSLRHVWVVVVSSFDLYVTELISETGLRLIDRTPPNLTPSLRQLQVPLEKLLEFDSLSPTDKLLFYKNHLYSAVQYKSFYRPEKLSEALGLIWTFPAKEKWARILARMKSTGRHTAKTEQDVRDELTLISDRRDLIAHSMDEHPGAAAQNPVVRDDAVQVVTFIEDLAFAVDGETESQFH